MAQTDKANVNLMTEGDYRKKIIFFAIPLFIGNLFQQLYNTADSLIVGNFLGPQALAAVSGVGSLVYLFAGFFMGFSTGAGVVIARCIGAGDDAKTTRAVHTDVMLGIILSVVMTLIGFFGSPVILSWMGTPADVFPLSVTYLRIYFAGFAGLVMYNIFTGILQAAGDSKHPLYYLVCSSLINIVGDVVLIAIFHMGVEGAAIATICSEILTTVLVMMRLLKMKGPVHLDFRKLKLDGECFREIFRFGLPTALQGSVIDISNILIQSFINSFGALAMAGIGAATKAEGFIFLPVIAFSMAMTTFISQNMGAKKYDRVKAGMHFGFRVALILIETMGIVMFFFAPQIISFFNQDPQVITYGMGRTHAVAFFYFLVGYSHIASAVVRGLGRPVAPMVVMLVCWCAVRVGVLFTVGMVWHNINLAYWIYPITWTLSSIVYFFYIRNVEKKELVETAVEA